MAVLNQTLMVPALIAGGGSLSASLDLSELQVVGLVSDTAWTAAAISFDASVGDIDGDLADDFAPLYNAAGEVSIASGLIPTAARRFFALNSGDFLGVRRVKVRSGLNGATVNQGAARALTLVVRPV